MKRIEDPFAPTPTGFHLRVEQTLNGLEEREMTRRKFTVGLAFALAVMLIAATAVAAAVSGGYMGWDGIYHSYSDEDATPPAAYTEEAGPEPDLLSILLNIPEGEYWQITRNGEVLHNNIHHWETKDEYEMMGLLSRSPLPTLNIPDGFSLSEFTIGTVPAQTPYEESLQWDGSVLSKYRLEPVVPEKADNCCCLLTDEDGRYITVNAWKGSVYYAEYVETFRLELSGEGEYGAVEVEGFDNAIYVDDNDGVRWLMLLNEEDGGNLCVHVIADAAVSKDELLSLFDKTEAPQSSAQDGTLDIRPNEAEIFALERDLGNELLKNTPDGEYWRINRTVPAGAYMSSVRYPEADFADAAALLAGAGIPVPTVPDGFAAVSVELHVQAESDPYEEIPLETGAVLLKYRLLPAAADTVTGFTVDLTNSDGEEIHIHASPDWKPEYGETVSVEGFDRADYLSSVALGTPGIHILSLSQYTDGGELVIRIRADNSVSREVLLSLFADA